AFDADEGADLAPQRLQLNLAEYVATLVAKQPAADDRPSTLYSGVKAKLAQDTHGIGLHGDAATQRLPMRLSLDEFDIEPAPTQRGRHGQAGDAAADDQQARNLQHVCLQTTSSIPKRQAPGLRTEPDGDEANAVTGGEHEGCLRDRADEIDKHPGRKGAKCGKCPPGIPAEALTGGADARWKEFGEIGGKGCEAADGKEAIERHEPK